MPTSVTPPRPAGPVIQWNAARIAGWLVARGAINRREITLMLRDAALRAGYVGDVSGLQARLSWRVQENAAFWERLAGWVAWRIKQRIAPLLLTGAAVGDILQAAEEENEAARPAGAMFDPLSRREVKAIVAEEMAWTLRRRA